MSFKIVFFVALCITISKISARHSFHEDYCWRDYDGVAPFDAFKAGFDREGNPIYIGQVLFEDKLIPGKIHHNKKSIEIEFWEAFTVNQTIKILCTKNPNHFKWVNTKKDKVFDLEKETTLFVGGYEKEITTYIGRARSFEELTVGKVVCWPTYCLPLSTVEAGKFYQHDEFAILTYDAHGTEQHRPELWAMNSAGSNYNSILLLISSVCVLKYIVSLY